MEIWPCVSVFYMEHLVSVQASLVIYVMGKMSIERVYLCISLFLGHLLQEWKTSDGHTYGTSLEPLVAITDTDIKERGHSF